MNDIARKPAGTPSGGQFASRYGRPPETELSEATAITRGVWVRSSRHGHVGRVTTVHVQCPEPESWIARQVPPISDKDRDGRWVSILCHGGGSVAVPIASVATIPDDDHPDVLDNPWTDDHFGTADPIRKGAWVSTDRYGHVGRVTAVHVQCPESESWIARQVPPISDKDRDGRWVSILCHGGGSVAVPIASVATIPAENQPDALDNTWTDHHFGVD